ncbi:FAD binding domain-containing protein [Paenibacillus aurantiacus]|uniref:FAD binding domain-containing protein n=1 Tax=Paenibacillus aurantiacus TaxID=1936118 RepID=A0ABV5KUW6_9BACL
MSNRHPDMPVMPVVQRPQEIGEAYRMKQMLGSSAVYTAGGTLLRTQWEAGTAAVPSHLIDLSAIPMLVGFHLELGELVVGACCPLSALRQDARVQVAFPLLTEAIRNIAAPSVRNLATLGGNVVSRIGDSLPALLVGGAELIWLGKSGLQAESLEDWLANEKGTEEDRLLIQIRLTRDAEIPLTGRDANQSSMAERYAPAASRPAVIRAYHKVGRREAFTPSVATLAVTGEWDAKNGQINNLRIAAGGGQTVPYRLERTERMLEAHPEPLGEDCAAEVHRTVMEEFEPKGDGFASSSYRKMTVANLLVAELWRLRERLG